MQKKIHYFLISLFNLIFTFPFTILSLDLGYLLPTNQIPFFTIKMDLISVLDLFL